MKKQSIAGTLPQISYRDYYRLQAIFYSDKFKNIVHETLQVLEHVGLPIPEQGFSKTDLFTKWQRGLVVKDIYIYEIAGEILNKFGIHQDKEDNEKYRPYIILKICFHVDQKPVETTLEVTFNKVKSIKPNELWVRVYPIAREKDWRSFYKIVNQYQKLLPDYKERDVEWDGYERDIRLYLLYLKVECDKNNNVLKIPDNLKQLLMRKKSIVELMMYYPEYQQIKDSYKNRKKLKDFSDERLYSIIDKCKTNFGDLNLL